MNTFLYCAFAAVFTLLTQEKDISGTYEIPNENTEVEIRKEGNKFIGVLTKAPNEKAIGTKVLRDLVEKDGKYTGKLYAIRKDKLVEVVITPKGDQLELQVGSGWRSKVMYWTKKP